MASGLFDGTTYVVNDHRHSRDIDTTGQNVGCDKNLGFAIAEFVDDFVTLGAFDTTGKGRHSVAFRGHATFNFCSRLAGLK